MRPVLLLALLLFPVALSAQTPTAAELFAARKLDEAKAAYQAILAKDRNNAASAVPAVVALVCAVS